MKTVSHPIRSIAFDGKRALFNNTGLGNYSRYTVDSIRLHRPEIELSLCSYKMPEANSWLDPHPDIKVVSRGRGDLVSGLWRHYGGLSKSLAANRPDIYHGLSNELPFDIAKAGIPSVVTIHDLIFRRIPENYKPVDRWLYNTKFRAASHNATRVIAISECTKKDIVELYGVNPDKIDVIYQSCNPIFKQPVSKAIAAEVKASYNLPDRYIIMVGTVEQRKNQLLAIEAMPMIDKDISLVIVGKERNNYGRQLSMLINELGVENRVMRLSNIPTAHLPALYSMSILAAYPSRYEGFGLPVIEAISSGTPVIAATGSCLEEAGGPGALYVNPDSPREFADCVMKIVNNPDIAKEMVEKGQAYVSRFDSSYFVDKMMDVYRRAKREYAAQHKKRGFRF